MRKIIFCVVLSMLLLCGCGDQNNSSSDNSLEQDSKVKIESADLTNNALVESDFDDQASSSEDNLSKYDNVSDFVDEEELPALNPFE